MREYNKIFLIGHPKTGTSSLRVAMSDLGIKTSPPWTDTLMKRVYSSLENTKEYFDEFDAITTMRIEITEQLYPNSLYICSYNDPTETAFKMVKHTYNMPEESKPYVQQDKLYEYGWANFSDKIKYITDYYDNVFKKCFAIRDRFLIINIIKEPQKSYINLCKFLETEMLYNEFPHRNQNKI